MQEPVAPNPYEGLSPDHRNRWVCVYPAYLNAKKTVQLGRRIPKKKAVDNPLCSEIRDVCLAQKLSAEIESKNYPREMARDQFHSGRVRVQLRNEDGLPCNESVRTRRELLLMLGEMIPKLKTRQSRGSGGAESGGGQGGGSSRKKKGKK